MYHILWASGTGNILLGIKTQQICCGPTRSLLGSHLFLSAGKSHPQSPLCFFFWLSTLGNFTAWSAVRVPFWWSAAYVRAPLAIKNGNLGSIKHGYESWGSLRCLVVSGGGSKRNRSWLAWGILGEAIWKGCESFNMISSCSTMTSQTRLSLL